MINDENETNSEEVEEVASEESGTGGADSPEEAIGVDEDVAQSEKDPDAGESKPETELEP